MGVYTTPLSSVFTPPASCFSHWTFEGEYYNSITGGLLIQNALSEKLDKDCFPTAFKGIGRVPSVNIIYSPGACPVGYSTAGNTFNGPVTTAICCPTQFSYMFTFSTLAFASSSVPYDGCISTYANDAYRTTVLARANNTDLNTTAVRGPITMWAQPISIAFRQGDLSLFTATASATSTADTSIALTASSASPAATGNPSILASQTAISSSTAVASQTASPSPSPSPSPIISSGEIAGIAIGAAVVLGLLVGLAIYFRPGKRRKQTQTSEWQQEGAPEYTLTVPQEADQQFELAGKSYWDHLHHEVSAREVAAYEAPSKGRGVYDGERMELP